MKLSFYLLVSTLLLSSCSPLVTPVISPTVSSTLTTTITPTIIWFPPTATKTPRPTEALTPTPALNLGIGDILFTDDFTNPSTWTLSTTTRGSSSLGENELTIAISQPNGYHFSVREQPLLNDFYAEITAKTRLCLGSDQYGVLIRFQSDANFYRYALSCDGQVRLDRVVNGSASSPQPWMRSFAFSPGAPSEATLGVWVKGEEMRFFVNDQYLFSAKDPLLHNGVLGVFARSAGDNALTVSFTDLVVKQVNSEIYD